MNNVLVKYSVNPGSGPERRIVVVFDGEIVKVWFEDIAPSCQPIIVNAKSGIEIIGAISEVRRI